MRDKVFIITGSSQGIGKALAEKLSSEGAKVVINSRSLDKVQRTVKEFTAKGYNVLGIPGNVADPKFCKSLRDKTIEHYGRIDFLINNAGLTSRAPMDSTLPKVYAELYNTNVLGSIYPTISMIDDIRNFSGGILFISSLAGIVGLPNCSAYSSTKRAIISLAETLKIELKDSNVYVGICFPGYTENDPNKQTIKGNGTLETLQRREGFSVEPMEKVVLSICKQMEKKKFRSFCTYKGRLVYLMYRFFPSLTLYLIYKNKKKYMDMQ